MAPVSWLPATGSEYVEAGAKDKQSQDGIQLTSTQKIEQKASDASNRDAENGRIFHVVKHRKSLKLQTLNY